MKAQLDDALGAEEMLIQLTERNLMLSEKIEEMRITIEDLEALKELNDELEESHIETEKALQDEISKVVWLLRWHRALKPVQMKRTSSLTFSSARLRHWKRRVSIWKVPLANLGNSSYSYRGMNFVKVFCAKC